MTEDVTSGWFDAHVVTGAHPAALLQATDRDAIAAHLDTFALSGALVSAMASWLHDPLTGNAEASAVATDLADQGVLACWTAVPPVHGEAHTLDGLVRQAADGSGVGAFRIHPRSHGYSPVSAAMDEFYSALADTGLPLCVDATELDWSQIATIATRFPTVRIVVSQVGYRELRNLSAALRDHDNLSVDLVNFAAHQAVEWLAANGLADRLLFATGLGLRDPAESVVRLAWSGVDDAIVRQIGSGNAAALFALPVGGLA
ncbi:amidohydrolase family protein [Kribbella sp. DT2]|uniref:amidohydrolase family protein n=1 Tax=Kribbella sp. DT2 TaxID=3393427 RepID=UPI003CF1EDF4